MSNAVASPEIRTKEVLCTLEELDGYKHRVLVLRFQDKLGISEEEAEQLFDDTKKFLFLCAASEDPISPNEVLDFGWHEFILFTEDYAKFCQTYFGRFIHHRPRNPNDPPTKMEGSRRALALAHQVLGESLSGNWSYQLSVENSDPCSEKCGCSPSCTDGE